MEPKTQKARGVALIKSNFGSFQFRTRVKCLPFKLIQEESDIDDPMFAITEPLFARPCPVKPQHGFVDSRIVKDKKAAKRVFREALEADPKAEMLLMPLVKADFSAIWAPGLLSIGPGNDGATSGHKSLGVRCTDIPPIANHEALTIAAGIDQKAAPYLEFVGRQHATGVGERRITTISTWCSSAPD